ncbi:sensor histidine kinase [Slackia piriformis]|uniref:sensor histidine kinase n=1 Tax=Slackia piriformis TaxID=626934 RepID=UPI0026DD37F3|nr:sensor histidine kinase [Slackia piriformis]MDO5023425.1 sensor histidine kinase [Slackia piriformis]
MHDSPQTTESERTANNVARFKTSTAALFLRDHFWAAVVWAMSVAVFSATFVVYGGAPDDALYCALLSAVALTGGFAWRLWQTAPAYAIEKAAMQLAENPDQQAKAAFDAALHRARRLQPSRQAIAIARAEEAFYEARLRRERKVNADRESMMLRWVHHAKTPLSVISLVADKRRDNDDFRLVETSASEMKRSLDQLLHIVRVDDAACDARIERIIAADALKACVKRMRGYFLERKVFVSFEGDEHLRVNTDAKALGGILDQIVANAVKYSPSDATVFLSCGIDASGGAFIAVQDEGCGIAPEDIPRVFDLFFTGKNGRTTQESSGIGLHLAKQAADALNIRINIRSTEGAGTTVTLFFDAERSACDSTDL